MGSFIHLPATPFELSIDNSVAQRNVYRTRSTVQMPLPLLERINKQDAALSLAALSYSSPPGPVDVAAR